MNFRNIIDSIQLHFQDDKELRRALYGILGFYPHHIGYYKQALMHKSVKRRNEKGRPLNNERLEFLGDAILDAVVGDIVFRHFEGKREGFLTNTRSKLVSRNTLGKLAKEMGVSQLIESAGQSTSHNSYMSGNAFEALVGAIYLDRGYDACMRFMQKRILAQVINIDKVAYKEVNFKSKLLEWSQKNRVRMDFRQLSQEKDKNGSPIFTTQVIIEGVEGSCGKGYSKKESHQNAARETLQRLRREPQYIDAIFAAKADRTKMEEEPVMGVPDIEVKEQPQPEPPRSAARTARAASNGGGSHERQGGSQERSAGSHERQAGNLEQSAAAFTPEASDEFSLDDITATPREKTREEIIAEAEAAAFAEA